MRAPIVHASPVPLSVHQPSNETAKARIVRALLEVKEFCNEPDLQEIIHFLSPHIGSEVCSKHSPRLAIMSLVTACDRFGRAGHLALFEVLGIACPPEDPNVQNALIVLQETWDLHPGEA
jgi:hypothetical protein